MAPVNKPNEYIPTIKAIEFTITDNLKRGSSLFSIFIFNQKYSIKITINNIALFP